MDPSKSMTYPILTPIPEGIDPKITHLETLNMELFTNASCMHSNLGGGHHGHLGLICPAGEYIALPNTIAWVDPVHPGPNPVHLAGATQFQIIEDNRLFKANLEQFQLCKSINNCLKNQLLAAVPDIWTAHMSERRFGYTNTTCALLLADLNNTWGAVTPEDLDTNKAQLEAPWDPTTPFEILKTRVTECQEFALPHDPISDLEVVRIMVKIMENTGLFEQDLRDWRKLANNLRTLAGFWTYFAAANKERKRIMGTQQAGYNAQQLANSAVTAAVIELINKDRKGR